MAESEKNTETIYGDISEKYILGEEIGRGSFSTVKKGKNKQTGKEFAIKCIQKKFIKLHLLEREIKIMKQLKHPHILPLVEVYENKENIYLVLELVTGGELFDKIVEKGNYNEKEASQIIKQILSAVEYLHSQGVVHRDLKPENLLCSETKDQNLHIYVADFGLSRVFKDMEHMNTYCGSPEYVGMS
jgi:calcium/calmodulin-dependent protein kinase I